MMFLTFVGVVWLLVFGVLAVILFLIRVIVESMIVVVLSLVVAVVVIFVVSVSLGEDVVSRLFVDFATLNHVGKKFPFQICDSALTAHKKQIKKYTRILILKISFDARVRP